MAMIQGNPSATGPTEVEGAVDATITDGTNTVGITAGGALKVAVDTAALPTGAASAENQTSGQQRAQLVNEANEAVAVVSPSTPASRAAWAEKGLRVLIGPTDPISNMPVVVQYDQHQVHAGESWLWDVYIENLAAASTYDVVLTVPAIDVPLGSSAVVLCPHLCFSADANDLAVITFHEAPTVTGGTGTARTPVNRERNGTYTAKLSVLDAPTVTGTGTLLETKRCLAAGLGIAPGGGEYVLKNNTSYLFRVTSGAAGCDIHATFHWYEDRGF